MFIAMAGRWQRRPKPMQPFIFQNLEFFVLLAPVLVAIIALKHFGFNAFRAGVIAGSLFFILAMPGISMVYAALVAGMLATVFTAARLQIVVVAKKTSSAARWTLAALAATTIVFILIKYETISALLSQALGLDTSYRSHLLPILGFAFLGVRTYGLFADIGARRIRELPALDFLSYFLFFPTFLAGPIDRFAAFAKELRAAMDRRLEQSEVERVLARLLFGAFKVFVVAGFLQRHALPFLSDKQLQDGWLIYLGAVAYYWYEYINFSGYSDMAISTARLLGLKLPENFNYPFLAPSLTELWRRWHMTLAAWLRDYIYYPLLFRQVQLFKPKGQWPMALLSGFSIFVTFVICGLWHGDAIGMILFGALSGLVLGVEAVATATFWPAIARSLQARPTLAIPYRFLCRLVTFHVAIATFAPVLLSGQQLAIILNTTLG